MFVILYLESNIPISNSRQSAHPSLFCSSFVGRLLLPWRENPEIEALHAASVMACNAPGNIVIWKKNTLHIQFYYTRRKDYFAD